MQKTVVQETEAQKKDEKDIEDSDPAYGDCFLVLERRLEQADAVVIGAGSDLPAATGLTCTGRWLEDHLREFMKRYDMRGMYSVGFYPFPAQEEKWAYWSRHIYYDRHDIPAVELYRDLYVMTKDKNHSVLTTNVDHQPWLVGSQDECISTAQGGYGLFQCKQVCHKGLYDNKAQTRAMLREQRGRKIPSCQVPGCPVCGDDMKVHLGCDGNFMEGEAWYRIAV